MVRQLLLSFVLTVFLGKSFGQFSGGDSSHVPDYLVESRIEKLNQETPIPLTYNERVQAYVDVYTKRRPDHFSGILARADRYFPLFEEYLDKYELPLELKYLAVIESALDPRARSSSGAYGLWQFLYQASRMFDLEVTSYIDERADPEKATDAACRYLKYLYANFDDWLLTLAAYNGGIGAVKEAIAEAGGERDYWKLRPYLSGQMKSYVPAFIAVSYAMEHYRLHGIQPSEETFSYDDLSTTSVSGGVSFEQISEMTGIPIEILRELNPAYKMDYIPVRSGPAKIVVPTEKMDIFHRRQPCFQTEEMPPGEEPPEFGDTTGRERTDHIVAPGEFFHEIAIKYQCRVEDLMYWNGLDKKNLHPGQVLEVWRPQPSKKRNDPIPEIENNIGRNHFNAGMTPLIPDGE